ncbi:hypothetical protein IM40_00120 [Candidatus Paracaedimonas acanthamoebae]|nr:hypothetical protein IM40_00120 [Candidatus Paracaedimonas acanthamoebae]
MILLIKQSILSKLHLIIKLLKNKNLLKVSLLAFLATFISYTYCYFEDKKFDPQNLNISPHLESIPMVDEQGKMIDPSVICSLTQIDEKHLVFCNYQNIFLLNIENGKARILLPPKKIKVWNPTGIKYNKTTKTLYVANYTGKDILLLEFDKFFNLILKDRYEDIDLLGPENIDVTLDGKICAIADYDASKLVLFDRGKKAWSLPIKNAHGVSFSKNEKSIYVTSLQERKIFMFNLQGKLLKETGKIEWRKNGYLWPTSISIYKDKVAITDAHTGKITILSHDLEPQKSIGGNGLGIDLFNMPYGIEYTPEGLMYVSDTFKGRIVKINPSQATIIQNFVGKLKTEISQLPSSNQKHTTTSPSISPLLNTPNTWIQGYTALGAEKSYKEYTSQNNQFFLYFPLLELPQPWRGNYSSIHFGKKKKNSKNIILNSYCLLDDCYYYWTIGANYTENDFHFTIIGSPQMPDWLVLYKGILCPVRVGVDFWIYGKELVSSRGDRVTFKYLTQEAMKKITPFIEAVQKGWNPLDAMAKHLYKKTNFAERLQKSFESKKGKNFYKELILANQDINKMRTAAKNYLNQINKDKCMYLIELSIAHMLLASSNK